MSIETPEGERAPVFKKWKGWYWLVMIVLFVQIVVYTLITNSFK